MLPLTRSLKWIDENLLKILLTAYIFLIPLYPKLPLKVVNYTYVAIRLEDFYVAFLVVVFVAQILRGKATFHHLFSKSVFAFWAVAFLATLSGIFLTKTIDYPQLGILHAARRVEYMIVFFIAAASIKSVRDFKTLLFAMLTSLTLVNLYGIGQRFMGFPAVSTMNPEFAKGRILFLTPEARLASTFAGHYDLAAYLVFLIPIVIGLYLVYLAKKLPHRRRTWLIFSLYVLSLLILTMTASRSSFIAYMISTPALLFFLRRYRLMILVIALSLFLTYFSGDLIGRFSQTFQIKQLLVNKKTGEVYVSQKITSKELPAGTSYLKLSGETKDSTETAQLRDRLAIEATLSGRLTNETSPSGQYETVTGFAADISFATRLQVEWPRAVKALLKNPILGTGPSSITESTDNNYLRLLGEFGLAGFSLFLFTLFSMARFIFNKTKLVADQARPVFYGLLFGLGGLAINAGYIDVFEASKVAYVLWYTMGIFVGVLGLDKKKLNQVF